jgi:MoxR-like ATPase
VDLRSVQELAHAALDEVERAVVGKREPLELVLIGFLADGHVLLEDYPGLGKTLAARSFADVLSMRFARIQFTPDLMPSDVTGSSIWNQRDADFEFRAGPIFANLLLADEINRAPPKTQAALLEAMQERQVTIEGETHLLEPPFLVVATQNPIEYEGTFPLPEAQLDRFMMRLSLGYPGADDEAALLADQTGGDPLHDLEPVVSASEVLLMVSTGLAVRAAASVRRYVVDLVSATRESSDLYLGASPRAGISLLRAAKALALLRGRDFVVPQDIKDLAPLVLPHRVILSPEGKLRGQSAEGLIEGLLARVPVPQG